MEVADKGNDVYHITPNLRKGTISLFKGQDDQLMHFSWKERPSGTVVDDIIILAEEAVYKKVNTGTDGDRVYLMEIAGNRRFFYWMQDKNSEKDEENMKRVNELTNSPPPDPAPGSRGVSSFSPEVMSLLGNMGAGAATPGLGGSLGASASGSNPSEQGLNIQNLQSILQNMGFSPQEQAQAAGSLLSAGNTPSTPPGEPAAPASGAAEASTTVSNPASGTANPGGGASGGGLTAADLQRAMMNLSGMAARPQQPPTRLTDVVNADAIEASGFLEDANVQQALVPLLADEQQTEQELRETLRSPQLQQALAALSQALQTENFNNIMSSFELDPSNPKSAEAMGKGDAVAAFLQALIHAAEAKREQETAEASDNLPQSGQEDDAMDSDQ
ncbi:unnamed protein product [Ascophyllum nodosum]